MSSETEALGAAVTASLAASAIEERKGKGRKRRTPPGTCPNCGAALAGSYCSSCGQPAHLHHALANLVEEFARGIVLFDTRAWRTFGMLIFRPGKLTHEYIRGKRARFISPMAMFLVAVFAMFAVFAFIGGAQVGMGNQGDRAERVAARVQDAEEEVADAEQELKELRADGASGGAIEAAQLKADTRRQVLESLRVAKAAVDRGEPLPPDAGQPEGTTYVDQDDVFAQVRKDVDDGKITVKTGWVPLDRNLIESLRNPELALYKVQNAAYKFAFLLVPISLPFVWLMFIWRRGTTLFDHTVYILYSLSFVSFYFIAFALMELVGLMGMLALPMLLAMPVHAFFHLKGGYALGWFSAAWRLPFQLIFSLIGLLIFVMVIVLLGVAG